VEAVKSWLTAAGISAQRIKQSQGLNWIDFDATVDEAENLLHTKYHVYEHENGQPHVACDEYSIPSHLQEHIDLVYPTVHFDAKVKPRDNDSSLEKRAHTPGVYKGVGLPGSGFLPKGGWRIGRHKHNPWADLSTCDEYTVPNCLRALYKFPVNNQANPRNSYGIVEYTPQAYVPSDLELFFRNFSQSEVGARPILDSIDGGAVQQTNMSFAHNGESDLDLEYAMTLVYPQRLCMLISLTFFVYTR